MIFKTDRPTDRPSAPPTDQPGGEGFLSLENLSLSYRGESVFANVSLPIRRGEVTALVGPSGCGKSSLLSCINRLSDLVDGARVTGQVVLDGEPVFHPSVDPVALRRRVGMLFQKPNPFPMSIRHNLTLALREHGIRSKAELNQRLETALTDVGLWREVRDRLDRSALSLSGGQQQRLCLARALALAPEVVLMDEPCSALDPQASATIEGLIGQLKGRYTVLIVTHNLDQARRVADRAALLWREAGSPSCLVEHGPAEDFFQRPNSPITAAYVGGCCPPWPEDIAARPAGAPPC